jgi:hypothetical protein
MRAKRFVLRLSSVLVAMVGCGVVDPDRDLSHAAAMFQCGPADGPTTVIVLAHDPVVFAQPSYPHVSVVISHEVSALAGRTWEMPSDTGAAAWYITGPGNAQSAVSGHVVVTSVDNTNKVEGAVELQFPSRLVATQFSAPWINSGVTCP